MGRCGVSSIGTYEGRTGLCPDFWLTSGEIHWTKHIQDVGCLSEVRYQ